MADHLDRRVLWISVCFECCVLSGIGLCDGMVIYKQESYGCISCVIVVCCLVEVWANG